MNADSAKTLSDEQLMSRIASGEVGLLGEIYVRHNTVVKSALGRFAQDISFEEREDLAQEVFIAVNDSASRFPAGVEFRAWLYGVAVKKARAWRRNNWIRKKLLRKIRICNKLVFYDRGRIFQNTTDTLPVSNDFTVGTTD